MAAAVGRGDLVGNGGEPYLPGQKGGRSRRRQKLLYSSTELETAVRQKLDIRPLIFRGGVCDMVTSQQELLYGRTSGTDFGNPDSLKYAESFECCLRVNTPENQELT
jgi:acetolactate synthase I/II/III large subunit